MRTKVYSLVGKTAAAASVAAAQLPTAGTALTLVGGTPFIFGTQQTFTNFGGQAPYPPLGTPMELSLTLLSGSPVNTYTVVGRDRWGQPLTVAIVTAGGAQVIIDNHVWSLVTSITPSVTDGTNNVSVGTPQRVTTPWVQLNQTRGFDQGNISYVSADGGLGAPTYVLEGSSASPNEQGVVYGGADGNPSLPNYYYGDNLPIDSTSTPTTFPTQIPAGVQWARLVISSATGSSAVARFVRPSF